MVGSDGHRGSEDRSRPSFTTNCPVQLGKVIDVSEPGYFHSKTGMTAMLPYLPGSPCEDQMCVKDGDISHDV